MRECFHIISIESPFKMSSSEHIAGNQIMFMLHTELSNKHPVKLVTVLFLFFLVLFIKCDVRLSVISSAIVRGSPT